MTTVPTVPIYPAIVACMNEARLPEREEIEKVAARIWRETRDIGAPLWSGLTPGSTSHRKTIRIALAALGVWRSKAITLMARSTAPDPARSPAEPDGPVRPDRGETACHRWD